MKMLKSLRGRLLLTAVVSAAVFAAAFEAAGQEAEFALDFRSPEFREKLPSGMSLIQNEGMEVLKAENPQPASNLVVLPVACGPFAGKRLALSCELWQNAVSAKRAEEDGVILALVWTGADGRRGRAAVRTPNGGRGWSLRSVKFELPAEARDAELQIGLENVSGSVMFRRIRLEEADRVPDFENVFITGECERDSALYRPGEPAKFRFRIFDGEKAVSGRLELLVSGDDGERKTVCADVSADTPAEIAATLNTPGFVMVRATLLTPGGAVIDYPKTMMPLRYGMGAGFAAEELRQGAPEPADFDAFWQKSLALLKATPMTVLEKKPFQTKDNCEIFDVSIAAPGPRPAVGLLSIPIGAKEKSLPLEIRFSGYGIGPTWPVTRPDAIVFRVNAHGIPNNGTPEYYRSLASKELASYGFRNDENADPEKCYFRNMILRDLRALEYAKSLPEWDGRNILSAGGSQGAFQAAAVAALDPAVTECDMEVPWLCDLGGITVKRTRGWRPDWQPALGYFDTVNFGKRIRGEVKITAGLSDWICPPSGVQVLYNHLKAPKRLTFMQGKDHGFYPGYNPDRAQKSVQSSP